LNWIGQHIVDFIARFRSSVYFENVENGSSDTDKFLILGSSGKLKYRTGAEVKADIEAGSGDGDITGVVITTDTGGGSSAQVLTGSADFRLLGSNGVGITNSGVTITARAEPSEIDHDSLDNWDEAKHFTQAGITTVGTIGTGVWNGTKITDIYTNSSGKRYGNTIKILPSDFMINEDAAVPLSFKDGGNSGVHINDTDNEALAFITIPEGMKATHVDVYATHNRTLKVWEVDLNASFDFTSTTKGTGVCNTQLDITDVNSTATNYLAIQIALSQTTQRIWGGVVTIAAQ
tara:strand:+ start:4348 stop:5217 length:870 start_codon:yes stop_codon:yes gene_type:complete